MGKIYFLVSISLLFLYTPKSFANDRDLYVGFYGAKASDGDFLDLLAFKYEKIESYLYAISLGKKFATQKDRYRYEIEAQIVKHFKIQNHFEFNALLIYRWLKFPWDHILDTSLAIGDGLSYASQKPILELEKQKTSRLLNYLMVEITFNYPSYSQLEIFTRIHHRSGIYKLINDVSGGSNFLAFGLRYRF